VTRDNDVTGNDEELNHQVGPFIKSIVSYLLSYGSVLV